mgnify:CR=1 FL=1
MKLAVNHSRPAARLRREGAIDFDLFKCPAWPDMIDEALGEGPSYIHFPLKIGVGRGVINSETGREPDWSLLDTLRARTQTPFLNLHLTPTRSDLSRHSAEFLNPEEEETLIRDCIRDMKEAADRCGRESLLLENNSDDLGQAFPLFLRPELISRIVEESGCGFLLDLSHACLAADFLGRDRQTYINALPLKRLGELHITGIQIFGPEWIDTLRREGIEESVIGRYAGRPMDHLPLLPEDWDVFTWAAGEIRQGRWGTPWAVTFEYGGISPLWAALTDEEVLKTQVPRLQKIMGGSTDPEKALT